MLYNHHVHTYVYTNILYTSYKINGFWFFFFCEFIIIENITLKNIVSSLTIYFACSTQNYKFIYIPQ